MLSPKSGSMNGRYIVERRDDVRILRWVFANDD
jgi:hypothetical protein